MDIFTEKIRGIGRILRADLHSDLRRSNGFAMSAQDNEEHYEY